MDIYEKWCWRCFVCVFSQGRTRSMPWTTKTCSICGTGANTIWPLRMGKCSSASILNFAYLRSEKCGRKQVSREKWKRMTFAAMESERAVSGHYIARFVRLWYCTPQNNTPDYTSLNDKQIERFSSVHKNTLYWNVSFKWFKYKYLILLLVFTYSM